MSTPTTFLFIRHAATDLAGTFCGSSDPPLNMLGRSQVEQLVTQLSQPIHVLYTSDLLRAQQTADAIAHVHQAQIQRRPALRELHFGDWETLTWEQIEARNAGFAAKWVAEFPNLPTPNGEPIQHFRTRILAELKHIRAVAEPGQTVAVVTHAGPLRVLLEEFGHYAPQHAWERTREYTCVVRATQTSSNTFTITN
jgi:alpha-ribazole phosphatase